MCRRARALDEAIGSQAPVHVDGVTVTPWDGQNADALIGGLFDMSAASFRRNAFFKPITKAAFLAALRAGAVRDRSAPGVVRARRDRTWSGSCSACRTGLEGERPRTAILKTYASARRGVGHLLADTFHRAARDLGFTEVIHALMHVDNVSLERSGRHAGKVFRRYALMGRRLS